MKPANRDSRMMTKEDNAFWGFPIDQSLHEDTRTTNEKIQQATGKETEQLRRDAAKIVIGLTRHGLTSYYEHPTKIVPLSPGMKRTADASISVVMGAIEMVIRQFFKKRSDEELKTLALYLEQMLWLHPEENEPYLVFSLEAGLHERAIELIAEVRTNENTHEYIDDVVDTLCQVVDLSTHHYYHQPTQKVQLGTMTRKTADMGIRTAEKGIRQLIGKLLRALEHSELVELSFHLETLIHQPDTQDRKD